MNLSHCRRMLFALSLLFLPLLGFSAPADKEKAPDPWSPATDAHAAMQLQAAADFVRDADWKKALRRLQDLLDDKADLLARLPDRDGKAEIYVNVHTECERLLAALPEAGRQVYQRTYGPRAADLLDEARQGRDAELLARIVARYLYTDAGPVALRELARLHDKAGRMHLSALYYARLLEQVGPARWTNDDLYRATIAFRHRGRSAQADLTLKQLPARSQRNVVRLEERTLTVEELRKEIEFAAPQRPEWPVYRGDAARSNRGVGGPPILEALWRQSMFFGHDGFKVAEGRLREVEKLLQERHEPIVSGFAPIAVSVRQLRGGRIPLFVCKTQFGIAGIDARNGRLAWLSSSTWSVPNLLGANRSQAMIGGEWLDHYQKHYPQIVFENSTVGTVSTDGRFVYSIDDLAVPPKNNFGNAPVPLRRDEFSRELEDAVSHNRLMAFGLEGNSGKLIWYLGGDDEKDPLHDAYFLAPPLPLDGLLYVLVQKQKQISLVCIDPATPRQNLMLPKIVFIKPLVETATPMVDDPIRRTQAAHLAYSDGVLVCPTNAGVVVGVDLLSRRLAWTYPYRDKTEKATYFPEFMPLNSKGVELLGPGDLAPRLQRRRPQHYPTGWKTTAPVVAEGKVVFTPPDDAAIHCLNLSDGLRVWSRKKSGDDVYLGGVARGKVLIVGTNGVRALSLSNGETLWTRETGLPSGQGVLAGDLFYLPLQRGALSKQPEICVLDIDKGRAIAHNRARPRKPGGDDFETPANLLFVEGKLISQSPWEIVAYPSLKDKLDDVKKRIGDKPEDSAPLLLSERAVLLRDAGRLNDAVADLRKALKNNPDKATRRRGRALLFDALSELFQRDPHETEGSITEYKELIETDLEGLTKEDSARGRAEQQRRQRSYSLLVARLRESQGRRVEALQAYLDLGEGASNEEMLPLPGEPSVQVNFALWVRDRIAELRKQATTAQRKQMEEELNRRLKESEKNQDARKLRDFVTMTGLETAAGREGRLLPAERALTQKTIDRRLEAELLLLPVSRRHDDRFRAARAVELLARLMTAQGLLPDAVYFYRLLRRDFGKTIVTDGNNGEDIWNALASDKRFLPYLDKSDPFSARRFKARKLSGNYAPAHEIVSFEQVGEAYPFFRSRRVGLNIDKNYFSLQSSTTGESVWEGKLIPTAFKALLPDVLAKNGPRFRYHTQGHLVVMPVDNMVYGIDPLARRVLWQKDTLGERSTSGTVVIAFDPRDGSPRLLHFDGWVQLPTHNLVLSPSVLCLATRTGLQGCDPWTGRLLWTRGDLPRSLRLFGDDAYVFAVEENTEGAIVSTHVLRLADGVTVSAPDFSAFFRQRVQSQGRTLVLSSRDDKGTVSLRSYHIPTGAILWDKTYPKKSIVLRSEDPRFTGAVEANGNVHIVDATTGKEVMGEKMMEAAVHLRKVETIHLLIDDANFYLACSTSAGAETAKERRREETSGSDDLSRRGVTVNGTLYVIARANGEMWYMPVNNQRLVLEQFRDMPLIFLTSLYRIRSDVDVSSFSGPYVSAILVHKRDGRTIYNETVKDGKPFHTVRADPRTGVIEYVSSKMKIVCEPQRRQPNGGK